MPEEVTLEADAAAADAEMDVEMDVVGAVVEDAVENAVEDVGISTAAVAVGQVTEGEATEGGEATEEGEAIEGEVGEDAKRPFLGECFL